MNQLRVLCIRKKWALAGWLSWLECYPVHQRLWIRFPIRAHAHVAGSIPGWGAYRRQSIDISLSFQCFCLSLKLISISSVRIKIKQEPDLFKEPNLQTENPQGPVQLSYEQ